MASLIGGVGISHAPSPGAGCGRPDRPPTGTSRPGQAWSDGVARVRDLVARLAPDHLLVVYNDQLTHFDLDNYPTLAVGVGARFRQADEGWGQRGRPDLDGDVDWGLHLVEQLVAMEFDLTVSHDLSVHHGLLSWLPHALRRRPVSVTPIAVNMVRQPLPTPGRLRRLGQALRACVASHPAGDRVMVVATGGMSHQVSGARFGIANEEFDRYFLRMLPGHLEELAAIPLREYMRVGGSGTAELALWLTMRAALAPGARELYRFQAPPALAGCGALVMAEPGVPAGEEGRNDDPRRQECV